MDLKTFIFLINFSLNEIYSILILYFPLETSKLNLPFALLIPPNFTILSFGE